jgi:hypothetical protein
MIKRLENEDDDSPMPVMAGRRPDPDPTLRTMQLVDKAIDSLRNELKTRFEAVESRFSAIDQATRIVHEDYVRVPTVVDKSVGGLRELLEARLCALEKLQELMRSAMRSGPDVITEAVQNLELLMDQKIATSAERLDGKIQQHIGETAEKFAGVGAQFSERDTRTDQRAGDTKLAVDAAFAAAKEATSKIEAGFTKQIDSLVGVMDTLSKNLDSKISDVKELINDLKLRVQSAESRSGVIDPSVNNAVAELAKEVRSLRASERSAAGASQQSTDNTARMFSVVAIAAAVVIGVGEIIVRVAH